MKTCTKCNIEKPYSDFYKNKNRGDGHNNECKKCKREMDRNYYLKNKDKIKERSKEWAINNKDKQKEYYKDYLKLNRDKVNEYKNNWSKKRRNKDSLYKLKQTIRSRIYLSLIYNKVKKNKKTTHYLGCALSEYKNYLQSRFKEGMSWDNHGEWHIDHIIPLASANTEEELISLFHYTNTQPLWAKENLRKGSSINFSYTNNNNYK